jgi:hypothetical protein
LVRLVRLGDGCHGSTMTALPRDPFLCELWHV